MKKLLTISLMAMLTLTISGFAQEKETANPLTDMEVERKVAIMDIEGEIYNDVVVRMKSISPNYITTDRYKVVVTITDTKGKNVWKKTLRNVFLYVFSNGQVQVGKRNFNQILIQKSSQSGNYIGWIREKEGVF